MSTWQRPGLTGFLEIFKGLSLLIEREQQELVETVERMKVLADGMARMQPEHNNTGTR